LPSILLFPTVPLQAKLKLVRQTLKIGTQVDIVLQYVPLYFLNNSKWVIKKTVTPEKVMKLFISPADVTIFYSEILRILQDAAD
jgi:hypothetical protein